jgi:hypothetical protein
MAVTIVARDSRYFGVTADVSLHGAFITSAKEIAIGADIEMLFYAPEVAHPLRLYGRVVRFISPFTQVSTLPGWAVCWSGAENDVAIEAAERVLQHLFKVKVSVSIGSNGRYLWQVAAGASDKIDESSLGDLADLKSCQPIGTGMYWVMSDASQVLRCQCDDKVICFIGGSPKMGRVTQVSTKSIQIEFDSSLVINDGLHMLHYPVKAGEQWVGAIGVVVDSNNATGTTTQIELIELFEHRETTAGYLKTMGMTLSSQLNKSAGL